MWRGRLGWGAAHNHLNTPALNEAKPSLVPLRVRLSESVL